MSDAVRPTLEITAARIFEKSHGRQNPVLGCDRDVCCTDSLGATQDNKFYINNKKFLEIFLCYLLKIAIMNKIF